jgi:hypothetical protein
VLIVFLFYNFLLPRCCYWINKFKKYIKLGLNCKFSCLGCCSKQVSQCLPWVFFCGEGPRSRCYGRSAALRLIVQTCDEDDEKDDQFFFFIFPSNGSPVEWNWQGKTEVLGGKTCPSATLSTTNPTWTDPGSNPRLRGGRPATNRVSHGTAPGMIL